MGFKTIHSKEIDKENFINNARGEQKSSTIKKNKRDKKILLSFTNEEYEETAQNAKKLGLSVNAFIRFKIFN